MSGLNQLIFNSIYELMEELDNSEHIDGRDTSSEDHPGGSDWCDTDDYEEARKYMIYGKEYPELLNKIEKYKTKGNALKRTNTTSMIGHNVIVPLYLQGIPQCMITNKKTINNKIVTIFYSVQAPYSVTKKQLINGATHLMKKIISLEKQGYRINLYIVEAQKEFGYCIKLKSDREIFNIKKLCFPLISPSILRRIGFRIKENLYKDWIGWGYGSGLFEKNNYINFINNKLKLKNYEIWNYEGKKYTMTNGKVYNNRDEEVN